MTEKQNIAEVLERYDAGTATAEEKAWVETWYARLKDQAAVVPEDQLTEDQQRSRLLLQQQHQASVRLQRWRRIVMAAAVLAVMGTGMYVLVSQNQQKTPVTAATSTDIAPGSDKAILTLADGSQVILDDKQQGQVATQSGIAISKTADGQLVYTIGKSDEMAPAGGMNTITTPRGGQYQVILPDGTHVWLNAASSLQYPVVFSKTGREVQLTGEACFDVTSDKTKPFKILTRRDQTDHIVHVLGTILNVEAYEDEAAIKTTLVEGAVRIEAEGGGDVLRPGQQTIARKSGTQVKEVDTESVVAWKNGYFVFEEEDLASVMRKIARWYDVQVSFTDPALMSVQFNGTVSRYGLVSQVIKVLELTQAAHFKITGNKIVVSR